MRFRIFKSCLLFSYLLWSDESNFLGDESDKLGYHSESSGTHSFCAFNLRSEESVVGVLGSDVFAPIGVESKGGIFASGIIVLTGVQPKGGGLLALFRHSNSLFSFQIPKSVL